MRSGSTPYRKRPRRRPARVLHLAERRPVQVQHTEPLQRVRDWLADAEARRLNVKCVAIPCFIEDADETLRPETWTAGMGTMEEIALADLMRVRAMEAWRS